MQITYIGHSGFFLELAQSMLLFDYYKGTLPRLAPGKKLYVFVSHRHPDHFNPDIFRLADKKEELCFLLSRDIWESRVPEELRSRTLRLKAGESAQLDGLKVQTLKSTDEGVAFLVKTEEKTIYHAGDLNDWRWAGEPEDWNRQMKVNFQKYIEPLRDMHIDAAFLPLDPRQEENYALGFDYFLSLTAGAGSGERVYPMHCWDDYSIIERWFSEHPGHPGGIRIVPIGKPGETFFQ